MFSLNGTLKKSGLVGRWETKQFIGMALVLNWMVGWRVQSQTKFKILKAFTDQAKKNKEITIVACKTLSD